MPLHTFGTDKVALVHTASGYTALADRAMVETARPDELAEIDVSFIEARDARFNPPLQPLAAPSAAVNRWAARITRTLNAYTRLSPIDRYFCDLQDLLAATE